MKLEVAVDLVTNGNSIESVILSNMTIEAKFVEIYINERKYQDIHLYPNDIALLPLKVCEVGFSILFYETRSVPIVCRKG